MMILGRTPFNYVRAEHASATAQHRRIQTVCWAIAISLLLIGVAVLAARSFDVDSYPTPDYTAQAPG